MRGEDERRGRVAGVAGTEASRGLESVVGGTGGPESPLGGTVVEVDWGGWDGGGIGRDRLIESPRGGGRSTIAGQEAPGFGGAAEPLAIDTALEIVELTGGA
eukprot:s2905_g5.t1